METKETQKTKEDLMKFLEEAWFVLGEAWDYVTNLRAMSDAVQFMNWSRYIEEMQPALSDDCLYPVADYYDTLCTDVIVFDTEIHWNFWMSIEEVADYILTMNERYELVKNKYARMFYNLQEKEWTKTYTQ